MELQIFFSMEYIMYYVLSIIYIHFIIQMKFWFSD